MRYSRTIDSPTESVGKRVSAVEEERQRQKVRDWEAEVAMLREGVDEPGEPSCGGRGRARSTSLLDEEDGLEEGDAPCGRGRARSSSFFDEEDLLEEEEAMLARDSKEAAAAEGEEPGTEQQGEPADEPLVGRGRARSGTCNLEELEAYLPLDAQPTFPVRELGAH